MHELITGIFLFLALLITGLWIQDVVLLGCALVGGRKYNAIPFGLIFVAAFWVGFAFMKGWL